MCPRGVNGDVTVIDGVCAHTLATPFRWHGVGNAVKGTCCHRFLDVNVSLLIMESIYEPENYIKWHSIDTYCTYGNSNVSLE